MTFVKKNTRNNFKMTNKHENETLLLKLSLSICFNNKKLNFNLHSRFIYCRTFLYD